MNKFPLHSLHRNVSSVHSLGLQQSISGDCWGLWGNLHIQQQVQQVEALRFQQISPHMLSCNNINKCHVIFCNWIICKAGDRSSWMKWIQWTDKQYQWINAGHVLACNSICGLIPSNRIWNLASDKHPSPNHYLCLLGEVGIAAERQESHLNYWTKTKLALSCIQDNKKMWF